VRRSIAGLALLVGGLWEAPADAQRTQENAAREADDGFGKSVGNESIGIYASGEVRGFSATAAGNNRIEGLYFDRAGSVTETIVRGSTVRVGLSAFGYPLPAPTGIIDIELRRAGSEAVASVQLNSGDYGGTDLIVDAAIPVTERLSINLDGGLYDDEYVNGAGAWFVSYGGVARWRPANAIELTGFFGRYDYGDEEQAPVLYPAGDHLPPRVERRRFFGQDWADWAGHSQNLGGLIKAEFGLWQIAAGAFNSRFTRDRYASAWYDDVGENGVGRSFVLTGVDQRAASSSGEVRVRRVLADGPRRHWVLASMRARDVRTDYGGYALTDLGEAVAGVPDPRPRPERVHGSLTHDRVRQLSYALGYEMRWPDVAEVNIGLTRSDYRKTVRQPGLSEARQVDRPWLWNAAAAVTLSHGLTLYGAATRGLEESGIAPANAANRGEALPALRTRQHEIGFRYAFGANWRLVSAAFDIAKPYFELDSTDGAFRELGKVSHRGVEASLSGRPYESLSVVAGAVLLRPRVSGQAVEEGRLGERPIGRTGLLIDVSLDYRLPWAEGLSVDLRATHEGRRVANATGTIELPARTVFDLGARHRTRIGGVPTLLRAQVKNAGDAYGWKVSNGGGFTLLQGRRATLSITADF
jgi:iron complex outermembrane recepter protein